MGWIEFAKGIIDLLILIGGEWLKNRSEVAKKKAEIKRIDALADAALLTIKERVRVENDSVRRNEDRLEAIKRGKTS